MLLIEKIIQNAIDKKASDVHIMKNAKPILRIKKNLVELENINKITETEIYDIYDYFLKGNIELDNEYVQNRKLDISVIFDNVRLRVNCSFSDNCPLFTIRIIENDLPEFSKTGIPNIVKQKVLELNSGLILITGKINSGKTTTLNCLIDSINTNQNKKIITLENPIEYKHENKKSIVIQKEVGNGKDVKTYIDGVRNSLREDCDILIIGEIIDKQTMDSAIEMAETGHLVIGTLHTNSCAETIDRIINFYNADEQCYAKILLSNVLKLVLSQKLLKSDIDGNLVLVPELLNVDNKISACIRKEKLNLSEIEDYIQSGFEAGNISKINSLANLYSNGKLSLEQIKQELDEKDFKTLNRIISLS